MKFWAFFFSALFLIFLGIVGWFSFSGAQSCPDSDQDGLDDCQERNIYFTEIFSKDTDQDGYTDFTEIEAGFSPHWGENVRLSDVDSDKDGLNDALELAFGSSLYRVDTDGDGYTDWVEVENGYDPTTSEPKRLEKKIVINTASQILETRVSGMTIGSYTVSTGRNDWTPKGDFEIWYKHPRAWSRSAKLWMPNWMAFDGTKFGIHALPEWPSGVKEGEESLGEAVSGGCVRLSDEDAQYLYEWAPIGTKVHIY